MKHRSLSVICAILITPFTVGIHQAYPQEFHYQEAERILAGVDLGNTYSGITTTPIFATEHAGAGMRGYNRLSGSLRGPHEYMAEFYYLGYFITPIQSSVSFGSAFSQVIDSTYPVTSLAIQMPFEPTENTYGVFMAFDGEPGSTNNYGRNTISLTRKDGVLYAGEFGFSSAEEDSEIDYFKIALGVWCQASNGTGWEGSKRSDMKGGYITAEPKVYLECENPSRGIGISGQFGRESGDKSFVSRSIGEGSSYTGFTSTPNGGIPMFSFASAQRTGHYPKEVKGSLPAETAMALSFSYEAGQGIAIQPDFQYVVNPGLTRSINHALVIGARVNVTF